MEQEPIPDWVQSKDYVAYREFLLMDKDTIIKKGWTNQDKLNQRLKQADFFIVLLGVVAIGFELLYFFG